MNTLLPSFETRIDSGSKRALAGLPEFPAPKLSDRPVK